VVKGEIWLDLRSLVAGAAKRSEQQPTSQTLNRRERAVLEEVFEGATNKEIAVKLGI
jgi:FixJ family two-component response regulator